MADPTLTEHLRAWLGVWPPPAAGLTIVGSAERDRPSWDGSIRPVAGIETLEGSILSVGPLHVGAVRSIGEDLDEIGAQLGEALGRPTWCFGRGVFRWSTTPTAGDDPGVWLPTTDRRVPAWLRPFNGDVLIGFADTDASEVAAGVGRKQHDRFGHELAVVTEENHRGLGWAKQLVTQAARRVIADGAVPTYIHAPDNHASARTAEAAGFPDHGWRVLGLFERSPN